MHKMRQVEMAICMSYAGYFVGEDGCYLCESFGQRRHHTFCEICLRARP